MMENKRNISAILFGFVPMIMGFVLYHKLPNKIPIHWNIGGNIDQYGDKNLVIIGFPLLMILISVVIMVIDNANRQNKKLDTALIWITPILSIILATMMFATALGHQVNIISSVALIVGTLLIILGNYLPKTVPNKYSNFGTKTIMQDSSHREKLNRLSGVWMVVIGILILCAGIVGMLL